MRLPQLLVLLAALGSAGCAASTQLKQPVGYSLDWTPEASGPTKPVKPVKPPEPKAESPKCTASPYPFCRLPDSEENALYFATNSFALEPAGEDALNRVANCLIRGTFRKLSVVIVGYADPRGSDRYNHELALQRAQTVRRYLLRLGVEPARVRILSRGKLLAQGLGPESWIHDRRVEIYPASGQEPGALNGISLGERGISRAPGG